MSKIQEFLKASKSECDYIGIREYYEKDQFKLARNGRIDDRGNHIQHGVMLEVAKDGVHACAATNDLTPAGLTRCLKRALKSVDSIKGHELFSFEKNMRPPTKGQYSSKKIVAITSESVRAAEQKLIQATLDLKKYKHALDTYAWAKLTQTKINYYSTLGHEIEQDFQIVTRDISLTARKNDLIQKRTAGMLGGQNGTETLDNLGDEISKIQKQMDELLTAKPCPSEKMDLILTPDQLYLQVHESIGHPLEIDRILGDERNYAGWSFINSEDFGNLKYGSEILNVTYDPTLEGAMASFAFDDNGVEAKKEYLIKEGKLLRGIGGIESQLRSDIPGVSCARATSWNRPAIDRMGNINIEPGQSSLEEMIESTENGVLMETNNSWSIDDYRNKFQFGCEYGRLIRDGELKEVVRNPNYRGQTVPFWNGLSHVGDESTFKVWGSPFCGKGEPNQIIRVGHAVPTCKFKNIEVFGEGQ